MGQFSSKSQIHLRFAYSPDEMKEIINQEIKQYNQIINQLKQIPLSQATFQNIVVPISLATAQLRQITGPILFLHNVSTDRDVRDASRQANLKINQRNGSVSELIYQRLIRIQQTELEKLGSIDVRLLNLIIARFDTNNQTRKRNKYLTSLHLKEEQLRTLFEENINEDQSRLILHSRDLQGCHSFFLKNTEIKNTGSHLIKANEDEINYILKYCQVTVTRRLIQEFSRLRYHENLEIIEQLHQVRTNIAQANGYQHSSDYKLIHETIGTADNAIKFINQILEYLDQGTHQYVRELEKLKAKEMKRSNNFQEINYSKKRKRSNLNKLDSYDYGYYHQQYLKLHYDIDHYKISEYFPINHVIQEMLIFFGQLFHLKFINEELTSEETWHPEVKYYSVWNSNHINENQKMGGFYLDLYPRTGKFKHFAEMNIIRGYQSSDGQQILPLAVMVTNFFNKLLKHSEVEILFHEFGHILHEICGGWQNKYVEMSGTSTEMDYVETPSQMMEQWVWEPSIIKRISKHYQTNQPLPDQIINNLIKSRYVGISRQWSKIAAMSKIDQLIHTRKKLNSNQILLIFQEVLQEYLYQHEDNPIKLAKWTHLADYDSQYYCYVWTMVLATDLYSRFKDNPLDSKIGLQYRKQILEPGGTKSGWQMIQNFLGRKPNLEAFFQNHIGLKIQTSNKNSQNFLLNIDQSIKNKKRKFN